MARGQQSTGAHNLAALRQLPLKAHLRQGHFGAEHPQGPGVQISVRHPLAIVTVIARKDKREALEEKFGEVYGTPLPERGRWVQGKGVVVQWCGPDQYFVQGEGTAEGQLHGDLRERLEGLASVSDQSHGRVVIRLNGPKARQVLAKGSAVDFHPRTFPLKAAAMTQMAHAGVHVACVSEDGFELSLFRGFSEHFWEWLSEQAQEFGYEVL